MIERFKRRGFELRHIFKEDEKIEIWDQYLIIDTYIFSPLVLTKCFPRNCNPV